MARRLTSDEVSTAAKLAGVPPALALAIWQQESSSGTNTKTSPKGAMGGFQVMPDTFRRYMPGGNMHDPVDNMHAGLAVLADGLRQSRGDWEGAAQFYYHGKLLRPGMEGPNSGPGTPSTRGYGQQVAGRAQRLQAQLGLDEGPAEYSNPVYRRPSREGMGALNDPMLKPYNMTEEGVGTYDFDSDPEELIMEGDDMDIPDYSGGLQANFNQFDPEMNARGSHSYELDRYLRKLVDDEFSQYG